MIPGTFKDAKSNRYDLNDLLALKLKQKKYNVLPENQISWPKDAVENPCSVLTAELEDPSNMFRNKILIKFFDCNSKEISSLEGKSSIKEFEPGMRDALEFAAKNIAVSNPITHENVAKSENVKTSTAEKTKIALEKKPKTALLSQTTTKEISTLTSNKTSDKSEVYSNGNLTLNKIILGNGEFILANPNSSVPYAIFKPSTKKDTFRVQLGDGTTTLGYIENGQITIEVMNNDGSFRTEIFSKK